MSSVAPLPKPRRRPTATSAFGVSRRESHDASAFYARFATPEISDDSELRPHAARNRIWVGDAREMDRFGDVADKSVALVVTSPPYFAGKEYEQALGEGHVPASYAHYLDMLEAVFAECTRKLEPGGRIAVNVANLGRKPYRSLAADVVRVLEGLGLLLRGEIVWRKQQAAGGSCAWGTYQRPANPVLRDTTERVVVAAKGRFDRALSPDARRAGGWPHEGSMTMDEFVDATTDVWEIPAESARKVGHPAPFPVELPRRLIELYTYRGDLILDPFMGGGATAVAAVRTDRYYAGFDTDADYVERARQRVADEEAASAGGRGKERAAVVVAPGRPPAGVGAASVDERLRRGEKAKDVARAMIEAAGFDAVETDVALPAAGTDVTFRARDGDGRVWLFDLCGAFSAARPGLRRADVLWKAVGKAAVVHGAGLGPLVLLSVDPPPATGPGARALAAVTGGGDGPVHTVVDVGAPDALARLAALAGTAPAGRRG